MQIKTHKIQLIVIDIIIFAILAFFVLRKLKSILGQEHDEKMFGGKFSNKIKDILHANVTSVSENDEKELNLITNFSEEERRFLTEIKKNIPGFSLIKFQEISGKVLESIISSYSEKNIEALSKLLVNECLQNFKDAIKNNEEVKIQDKIILVKINNAKIFKIKSDIFTFKIDMKFQLEQIHYSETENGEIQSGNKGKIFQSNEIWTFEKIKDSKSNRWLVSKIEICHSDL